MTRQGDISSVATNVSDVVLNPVESRYYVH